MPRSQSVFLQTSFRGFSFELLEFYPSVSEDLCGSVEDADLGRTDISGVVGQGEIARMHVKVISFPAVNARRNSLDSKAKSCGSFIS